MAGLREFVNEEAERARIAAAAAAASSSSAPRSMHQGADEEMSPPPGQEQCKRQWESPGAPGAGQPGRVLKKNKSNEEAFGNMPPRNLFQDEEPELAPDNDPEWMRALKGLMKAQTKDIKDTIGEQSKRISMVQKNIVETRR